MPSISSEGPGANRLSAGSFTSSTSVCTRLPRNTRGIAILWLVLKQRKNANSTIGASFDRIWNDTYSGSVIHFPGIKAGLNAILGSASLSQLRSGFSASTLKPRLESFGGSLSGLHHPSGKYTSNPLVCLGQINATLRYSIGAVFVFTIKNCTSTAVFVEAIGTNNTPSACDSGSNGFRNRKSFVKRNHRCDTTAPNQKPGGFFCIFSDDLNAMVKSTSTNRTYNAETSTGFGHILR